MNKLYTIQTMPQGIFDQWIYDLENGSYPQSRGSLFDVYEGYCCLGVLNARLELVDENQAYLQGGTVPLLGNAADAAVYLDWKQQTALAQMNDDGATFKEIADYLKKTRNG